MPQEIFEKLCIKLRPSIQKNKRFRDPVSVEKQVAAALYYLVDEGTKSGKFFWYREMDNFEKYQACFIFTSENFSRVSI